MPVYNAAPYVATAIESLLAQTWESFEVLVGDDGSSDGSWQVLERYSDPRIAVFRGTENVGKPETVTRLFKSARGRYITVHDADDFSIAARLQRQVESLEGDPGLAMCGTGYLVIDARGRLIRRVTMASDYETILRNLPAGPQFLGASVMFRTEVLQRLGVVYRSYFRRKHEDNDLCYRVAEGFKAINLPDLLYACRVTPDSLSRRNADVKTVNLYKFVVHLSEERRTTGTDCLARGDQECALRFWSAMSERYQNDRSLIHREVSAYYAGWELSRKAVVAGLHAIISGPVSLINYKHFVVLIKRVFGVAVVSAVRRFGPSIDYTWRDHLGVSGRDVSA